MPRPRSNEKVIYPSLDPDHLIQCLRHIAEKRGWDSPALLSQKPLSRTEQITIKVDAAPETLRRVREVRVDLSWLEAMAAAMMAVYVRKRHYPGSTTSVGVQIDDAHQAEREQQFVDGVVLRRGPGSDQAVSPLQHVIAQNVIGDHGGEDIERLIIESIRAKNLRRDTYGEYTTLLVSALPAGGSIDLRKVMKEAQPFAWPIMLMIYGERFSHCNVFRLDGEATLDRVQEDRMKFLFHD